jgi:signal peptide peptidase SppA
MLIDMFWSILPGAINPLRVKEAADFHLERTVSGLVATGASAPQQAKAQAGAAQQPGEDIYDIVNGVAMIPVRGLLSKYPSFWSYFTGAKSMQELTQWVKGATADQAVNSILLQVDSPGGTVAGVSDLVQAVYDARKIKDVIAYISDLGASAAYHIASQADRIYADVDAMVGSIGTYIVVPDWSEYAKQDGVKIHVVRAGEFKGAGTPGTVITDEQLADFQRIVDESNETFLAAVARGREVGMDVVRKWADGRVHVGENARRLGLVDGIRTLDEVIVEMAQRNMGNGLQSATWKRI